ncbi:MAG: GDP-mannose 4,6-dehydratase [Armatimonadetes bacterium]|nr:GDP-mannose 4,6-dehydratase [Armatimonadota bacterium]
MRVLITGITGFVGSYLAEYFLENYPKNKIYGTLRWRSRLENIEHIKRKINLIECDLKDANSVSKMIEEVVPDYIFHLAAQSFVPTSWHAPTDTLTTNIVSQINIFEAVKKIDNHTKIQIAGSSEEYGLVLENELPIKETNPLRPLSPYGVSKVAQDLLGYQYFMSYKMSIVRTRAFNHTGPRRGEVFVESNFARQIVEIEKGYQEPIIKVGNLEAKRDYTDVRDIVRAYHLALEKGESGEIYNICSGKAYKINEVLELLLSHTKIKIKIQEDPDRFRPSDVPVLLGDNSKFKKKTKWTATINFEQTLKDILAYWRKIL